MGGVVHFEIPADDRERAKEFYKQALGWRIEPVPEMNYSMVVTTPSDESLGGAVVKPKETIPGMGSFAYFRDTEGNVMGLWENLPAGGGEAGEGTI